MTISRSGDKREDFSAVEERLRRSAALNVREDIVLRIARPTQLPALRIRASSDSVSGSALFLLFCFLPRWGFAVG
jgi:hypothetical protein